VEGGQWHYSSNELRYNERYLGATGFYERPLAIKLLTFCLSWRILEPNDTNSFPKAMQSRYQLKKLCCFIMYSDQQMQNYFTNYHTFPIYFDAIVSSLGKHVGGLWKFVHWLCTCWSMYKIILMQGTVTEFKTNIWIYALRWERISTETCISSPFGCHLFTLGTEFCI